MADPLAHLERVDHTWPVSGTRACREVSLDFHGGAIHALVGENGAGKTTLGHILAGVQVPDHGRLTIDGRSLDLAKGRGALIDGVGLVRQRGIWPAALSVGEAAGLGRPREQRRRFADVAARWGLSDVDPSTPVSRMDAAGLQRAELIAALITDPAVLVLDEPAAAWEEGRSEEFFRLLTQLRDDGRAVILITHRLDDVFRIADRLTVLRRGAVAADGPAADTSIARTAEAMFGEGSPSPRIAPESPEADSPSTAEVAAGAAEPPKSAASSIASGAPAGPSGSAARIAAPAESAAPLGAPVLHAESLDLSSAGRPELRGVSFTVRSGEILGITGLREEGLAALEDVVSGNRRPARGVLSLRGRPIRGGAAAFRRAGLRYVPADQTGRGASLASTVAENMMVLEARRLARRGWLSPGRMERWTHRRKDDAGIDGAPRQKLEELSGGNIQKVILQREVHRGAALLVLADPTRGLDEKSRQRVHRRLRAAAEDGAAILLLASDLDEALDLADRLAVISGGRLSKVRPTRDWDRLDAARAIAGAGTRPEESR